MSPDKRTYCIHYFISTIIIYCCIALCGCDSSSEPVSPETVQIHAAPAKDDPKLYVCPSQILYHLANCPELCADKEVMLKSEAALLGYEACGACFPVPVESATPRVYIMEGENVYHLAGCPFLDDTKIAIPKDEADEQGYTPCSRCNYNLPPTIPCVYVNPEETVYHKANCPDLSDDKILMVKTEAIDQGYTECAVCYYPTLEVISNPLNKVVYVCPEFGEVYHGFGCSYLDQCNAVESMTLGRALKEGYMRPCERCGGFRYYPPSPK